MTAALPEPAKHDLERDDAARTAELAELLGHVTHCWDDERRLLARQLHDNLGSTLTALSMHLSLLSRQMPAEKHLQDRGEQMKQLLLNIIESNRKMQLSLWNDKLEFLGIKVALAELVREFSDQHQLIARVSLPEHELAYPRTHGVALLRCVEEGLGNALRHAQASEIDVVLDDNDDEIMLTVRDNGLGLSAAADRGQADGGTTAPRQASGDGDDQSPRAAGTADHANARAGDCHGVRLIRERVLYLGGTLSLCNGEPNGAILTMTLPQPLPLTNN
jgi:signal transduction histidine kinase